MEQLHIVIGNGEGRLWCDLNTLRNHITYGCNAIHRNFDPTYLIACDRQMCEEIVDKSKTVYTRSRWYNSFSSYPYVQYLPELPYQGTHKADQPMNWGSGTYAAYMACINEPKKIYFLGFDLYSVNNRHNNVYKGTPHYNSEHSRPVDPAYWIYQLKKLHSLYPSIEFIYVNPGTTPTIGTWGSSNTTRMTPDIFKKVLGNES